MMVELVLEMLHNEKVVFGVIFAIRIETREKSS